MPEKLFDLLDKMVIEPDDVNLTFIFNACAQLNNGRAMKIGNKFLHEKLNQIQNNNIILNSATHMLMKFGDIRRAEHIFEMIKKKGIFSYSSMMKGYVENNMPENALDLFERMSLSPNDIIYIIIFNACSKLANERAITIGKKFESITKAGKVGSIQNAEQIFQSISNPDVIANTTMINAYGLNGTGLEAVQLYRQIPHNLVNDVSHVCVLNTCSHSGLLDHARSVFNEIIVKTEKITALCRFFLFDEAQNVLDDFEKFNSSSLSIYMVMLSGARNNRNSVLSQRLYNQMKSLFSNKKDDFIAASILLCNTYSSLGQFEQAAHIRSTRIKEFGKNVKVGLTWTEANGELVVMFNIGRTLST
ncbi:unnamed protein product [Rotaria socialis]|uniref:Pentatricopeptide repeat-containing protein n=1 Tax=Rotaria socialis TaxID=392032 RepID=A0A818HMG3_9BILA|nr:unnamed protein product [Rotaria socialis]